MRRFNCTYRRVQLFRSIPNSYHNMNVWNQNTVPLLYVTGLSGSGKTTICAELANQYGCPYISLDALRFYDSASIESRRAVDEFLCIHPNIATAVKTQWPRQGFLLSNERDYAKYTQLFVQFLHDRAMREQKRYIVEGIQLFVRLPKETLLNQPKIILGTGGLECFYRATKRTYPKIQPLLFPQLIQRFMRYCIIQMIRLNCYEVYWERHE